MNIYIFALLFSFLSILYIIIGYKAAKKISSVDDYFLAGRQIGIFPLTITLIATQLGGGVILGTSREGFISGLYGLAYVVGICLGFILLAAGIARRLRSLKVTTTAEIFTVRYESPILRKIASLFFIVSLGGLLAAQVVASKNLMISLGVYNPFFFIAFWALIILYTLMGGFRAIVHNDMLQLACIIVLFVGIFLAELCTQPHAVLQTLTCDPCFFGSQAWTISRVVAIVVTPMLFSLIEQDIAQGLFAARTSRVALIASLCAAIGMLLFAIIPVYFGMHARLSGVALPVGANPLLFLFDQKYPAIIVALAAYGIFAAIISTADALLCATSAHFVRDLFDKVTGKRVLTLAKITTLLIGISALAAGHYADNIIDVIVSSYDIPVSALFVSLIIAYFAKKPSRLGAWFSIIAGTTTFFMVKFLLQPTTALIELIPLLVSLIGFMGGTLIDRCRKKAPVR